MVDVPVELDPAGERSTLRWRLEFGSIMDLSGSDYLSMTWTTPLATRTSGMRTLALLTNTLPPEIEILTLSPVKVVSVWPFLRAELYPTVPFTTAITGQ